MIQYRWGQVYQLSVSPDRLDQIEDNIRRKGAEAVHDLRQAEGKLHWKDLVTKALQRTAYGLDLSQNILLVRGTLGCNTIMKNGDLHLIIP
ncbi:MAG: hypothetical protein R2940_05125 [Syntrophotaleaceae bacterium]